MKRALIALCLLGCTPAQKVTARTALDVSICIQQRVLERIEDDLKDPTEAAELAIEIAQQCNPHKDSE
jgi:hypothetical protein